MTIKLSFGERQQSLSFEMFGDVVLARERLGRSVVGPQLGFRH